METNDSEKERLQNNLKQAVMDCKTLKIGKLTLESSFKITPLQFLDFTDEKYEDGSHCYKMESSIKIMKEGSDFEEKRHEIHFYAQIDGTDVEIDNGLVIAE